MDRTGTSHEAMKAGLNEIFTNLHNEVVGHPRDLIEPEQVNRSSREKLDTLQQQEASCKQKRQEIEELQTQIETGWKDLACELNSENLALKIEKARLEERQTQSRLLKSRLELYVQHYFVKFRVARACYVRLIRLREQHGPEKMWAHVDAKTEEGFDEILKLRLALFQDWQKREHSTPPLRDRDAVVKTHVSKSAPQTPSTSTRSISFRRNSRSPEVLVGQDDLELRAQEASRRSKLQLTLHTSPSSSSQNIKSQTGYLQTSTISQPTTPHGQAKEDAQSFTGTPSSKQAGLNSATSEGKLPGSGQSSTHNIQNDGPGSGKQSTLHETMESQKIRREKELEEAAREEERKAAEAERLYNTLNANHASPGIDRLQKNVHISPIDDRRPSVPAGPKGGNRGELQIQAPTNRRQPWGERKQPGHPAGAPSAYDRIGDGNRRAGANRGGRRRNRQPNFEQLDGQGPSRTRPRSRSPARDPRRRYFNGSPEPKKQRRN